jgi:hypothetical protein
VNFSVRKDGFITQVDKSGDIRARKVLRGEECDNARYRVESLGGIDTDDLGVRTVCKHENTPKFVGGGRNVIREDGLACGLLMRCYMSNRLSYRCIVSSFGEVKSVLAWFLHRRYKDADERTL